MEKTQEKTQMNSKLSTITIIFTAFSAALDIFTTLFLLGTGQYHEFNLLYYILGETVFIAMFTIITVIVCEIVVLMDRDKEKTGKKMFRIGLAIISSYGWLHFFLGIQQLAAMIRML
jgi:hypothetical protein